jgi:hypothetical protein
MTPLSILTPCAEAARALAFQYRHLLDKDPDAGAPAEAGRDHCSGSEEIHVDVRPEGGAYDVSIDGQPAFRASGTGGLLHELDNHLSSHLQRAAPRFYYVHAACLAGPSGATLIVGESGAGKSTTALALSAAGATYLTDELVAIDLATRKVLPYPRAICLKQAPPAPLTLPEECLRTEWTLHVQAEDAGAKVAGGPVRLERIIFLRRPLEHGVAELRRLSRAEAAMNLYQGALNQLAHPAWGVDDTLRLVKEARCYEVSRGGVEDTLAALREAGAP